MIQFQNTLKKFLNLVIILAIIYFLCLVGAKVSLKSGYFSVARWLFTITLHSTGTLSTYVEQGKFDKAKDFVDAKSSDYLKGLYEWSVQNYPAAEKLLSSTHSLNELSLVKFKSGQIKEAKELALSSGNDKLYSYILLKENKITDGLKYISKDNDWGGFSAIFFHLGNLPSALYYLLKSNDYMARFFSDLCFYNENTKTYTEDIINSVSLAPWIQYIRGNYTHFKNSPNSDLQAAYLLLTEKPALALQIFNGSQSKFTDSLDPIKPGNEFSDIEAELLKDPSVKIYNFIPADITVADINKDFIYTLGIILGILIFIFLITIIYLFQKYKEYLEMQRQKDLEKLDALSVAKHQKAEAGKKRDKTELNVASFVTLNLQLEVLDCAYTKLGLRVDPVKLKEQVDNTKIPNISYKIYTISNAYNLQVKMANIQPQDLIKQKAGAIILILKGDLIALLKRADNENAYLQFSQKESRKVPYKALKLTWEGNIIQLNR